MVKHNDVVTRNGNLFHVKKQKDGHYSIALMMGNSLSYRRMSKSKIEKYYKLATENQQKIAKLYIQ